MSEAKDVFDGRKGESHIQREWLEEFLELCDSNKAISGLSEEERKQLQDDIENDVVNQSNDMEIEMIIDKVKNWTKDARLLEILEKMYVGNIPEAKEQISGRTYKQYYDGSYYIEIGRKLAVQVRLLADVLACYSMKNEKLSLAELIVLEKLLEVNKDRYKRNIENTDEDNEIQRLLIMVDYLFENNFTDKYVAYSREIEEMAIAFLIGHEIGHHYYSHFKKCDDGIDRKKLELQADLFGMEFAFDYLEGSERNENRIYGIHQFAGVYVPALISLYSSKDIEADSKNHPSALIRFCVLDNAMKKKIDDKGYSEVKDYISNVYNLVMHEK